MPSHITHLVFAEESVSRFYGPDSVLTRRHGTLFALGAQGPDVFFHNQRTMPTGIRYGVLVHRHGYGKFLASMVSEARSTGADFDSAQAAFLAGYLTHAVLDRHTHPFINYFSGWVDPDDNYSTRYRSMHPFFERIVDLFVLSRFRGIDLNSYDFFSRVDCGVELPAEIERMEAFALLESYRRTNRDGELVERLRNAYRDTMGYYRYSNRVTPARLREGLRREQSGELGNRWLAILHPFALDPAVDYLNEKHTPWCDPCDDSRTFAASFWDLMHNALEESVELLGLLQAAWVGDQTLRTLEERVGNGGLSDTTGRSSPCRKRYSRPLPLVELLSRLRRGIAEERLPESPPLP
ncbi:zinc dependent phospholipase C family protein [Salinispira pacifica]